MSNDNQPTSSTTPPPEKKNDGPVLRDHVYDGIQEFDQKLPNWWLFTLYGAIVFFVLWWVAYYHLGLIKSDAERLDPILAEIQAKRSEAMFAMLDDPNLWKMSRDATFVKEGQQTYQQVCLPCHGPELGGNKEAPQYIGRSLIDDEWAHGGTPTDVYKMIYDGTPDPAAAMASGQLIMPPQGITLGADKVAKVTAYVLSKHPMPEGIETEGEGGN